jgi:diguanylate cyclase (GGDEF)-like protein
MMAGVLIVAEQRELRRRVFDALDQAGYAQIYSARDITHAAILLEGRPPLQLMVVVIKGDGGQGRASCEQLRQLPATLDVPLMVITTDEAPLHPDHWPAGTVDWLHASRVAAELLPRWRRASALAGAPLPALPQMPMSEPAGDPYAFQEDDSEWLIAELSATCPLLEVSSAVIRHSRLPADHWKGRALSQVLSFEGVSIEQVITEANRRWYPCQRRSAEGSDTGQANARLVSHDGRDAVALIFRSDRADLRAEAALSLLSRMFASTNGVDAQTAAARLLFDELGLDYLAVWSLPSGSAGIPVQQLQLWNGPEPSWPPPAAQPSLTQVLAGGTVTYRHDGRSQVADDPLLQVLGLTDFAGMPLYDERHTVLGAMLAGSRRGFGAAGIVEPVLHCAAARFAQMLELGLTREQGRSEGLLDSLTGLPNRLLFNDRLETIIREAVRNGECFAVLFVDLDRFKAVNDSHGHAAGDAVLRSVSRRLCGSVRASDTVARYAGDEFTVVLRHIVKNDDVLRVAEKIVQVMETPLYLDDGTELQITVSMGVSFFPDDASDAETLLKHADEAMYAAKHLGRNNFQIYEVSPEYAQEHGMALKTRLRHAEGNGELRVVYQPQVNTETEDIVGMEALLRWEHPELGTISPAVFIPLAEETGLIVSIGEWVMRTACRQAREWEERYGLRLRLGVNLSAVQLMEPRLLDTVAKVLMDTGLDPDLLEMEVTESISIKEAPNLVENLHGLHELGCHIAIDDFGTGAASLDYLRRLPADRIKIDQSFVRNIGVDPDDEAIVRATIEMAHRLKRAVVAEGVEIEQHLEFLRAHGCDELQGYLFCRPATPVSFGNLLAERQRLLSTRATEPA